MGNPWENGEFMIYNHILPRRNVIEWDEQVFLQLFFSAFVKMSLCQWGYMGCPFRRQCPSLESRLLFFTTSTRLFLGIYCIPNDDINNLMIEIIYDYMVDDIRCDQFISTISDDLQLDCFFFSQATYLFLGLAILAGRYWVMLATPFFSVGVDNCLGYLQSATGHQDFLPYLSCTAAGVREAAH